jgi:endonuclease/exonuclease/phosphatase (EEP) superfamily protein YafD
VIVGASEEAGLMKLISWNMAAAYGYDKAKHDAAWDWLARQEPDVCLLQEVVVPDWATAQWPSLVFQPKYSKPWGSAVLSQVPGYSEYEPSESEPWLRHLRGPCCVAQPPTSDLPWLVSIHSSATSYTPEELARLLEEDPRRSLEGVARCASSELWEIELAIHELRHTLSGKRFLAGGDLNSALLFDTNYGGSSNRQLFANIAAAGFHDLRPEGVPEQKTFFRPGTGDYQLDHVFADGATAQHGYTWEVDTSVAGPDAPSDHAALVIVFD